MIQGTAVDPRVEEALERALALGELGVQVAAYLDGELIVDAWVGDADAAGTPVTAATLFPVFSVSKAITATAVHLQAQRGLLELDAPIARYWPAYAANGKGAITIRDVLTHRAGVPQMPPDLTVDRLGDWEWIVGWLEQATPLRPPGTRSQYHRLSFGHLLGEVVRRTDPAGRAFGGFVREELCAPLGIRDLFFGVPAQEEPRVAQLTWGEGVDGAPQVVPTPLATMAMPTAVDVIPDVYNQRAVHAACIPAAGGIMSARAAARLFSLLAGGGEAAGVRLLARERLLDLTTPRPDPLEIDEAIAMPVSLGIGGYWIGPDPVTGDGRHVLAHGGAGGSIGWADLDTGLAVAITHNRMFTVVPEGHPFVPLADAVRAVAAEKGAALVADDG
jgi:CubicO group peptidase (beta-lactamase class C family)